MPEDQISPIVLTPQSVLHGTSPLVLTATLRPVAGSRPLPAGRLSRDRPRHLQGAAKGWRR